ncbi:hypothetical protein PG984_003573 [Apiospora sp. TS-2023a]
MDSITDQWQVSTFKQITDADGNLAQEQFTELVEPGHKLLEQSYSPRFIKGEPGTPQHVVFSVMVIKTGDHTVCVNTPRECTVPEYQIMDQASLTMHYEKRWAAKPRQLLHRYCGPETMLRYDLLEGKANEYLRFGYLKGKTAEYLRYDYLKRKAAEYSRRHSAYVSKSFFPIVVLLLLVLFTTLVVMVKSQPDSRLEKSYQTHMDIGKMLNATRPVRSLSLDITHRASHAQSIGLRIGHSQLPGKGEIVKHITTTAKTMHVTARQMQTYRHSVRKMALRLQWDHQSILARMGPVEPSKFPWYIIESLSLPSKRQLQKEWIANTVKLGGTLVKLIEEAENIDVELSDIEDSMLEIEDKMGESQKTQVDAVRGQENSWFRRVNIFAVPTEVYEEDIKLIDSFLPDVEAARAHVGGLLLNLQSVYDNLADLKQTTYFDTAKDVLSHSGVHQNVARESLELLGIALQFEVDASLEPATATATVTVTAATLPTG